MNNEQIYEDILKIIRESTHPQTSLDLIAELISKRFHHDSAKGRIGKPIHYKDEVPSIRKKRKQLRGVPLYNGSAEGYAVYFADTIGFNQIHYKETSDNEKEIKRLDKAFKKTEREVFEATQTAEVLNDQDKTLLEALLMFVQDSVFKEKIIGIIQKGLCAEYALKEVVELYMEKFSNLTDPYLAERAKDIEDMGKRVLSNLMGFKRHIKKNFARPTILIASDLSPVDLLTLRQENLNGIVLSQGGKTSHTVILAKSFDVPIVVGAESVLEYIKEDDFVIIDSDTGKVFVQPSQEIIDTYTQKKDQRTTQFQNLGVIRDKTGKTLDGFEIRLGANIGSAADIKLARKYGADHIGLYRTEFAFINRKTPPSEERQHSIYKKIINNAKGLPVTIRTLDLGGDKFVSNLDNYKERNPCLGWRSIRVSLTHDPVFRSQIRAILKASADDKINLLLPMISTLEEVRQSIQIVIEEKENLKADSIPFDESIKIGIMAEVPGVIRILDPILDLIDFVSIGTNDLIQFLLAVDRNNPKVAHMYTPFHPAVISSIYNIVTACKKHRKYVSICGESLSNPQCAYLYLGMKVDGFSMIPQSIPAIKNMIRNSRLSDAEGILEEVLRFDDAKEIADLLSKYQPRY